MHVINTADPVRISATAELPERFAYVGSDDRGVELEIVALDLPDYLLVIHVMPTHYRKGRS